jgi:hypothetical protein
MSTTNIKLNKKAFSNKPTELLDNSFSDLIKIEKPPNTKKFFKLYNEVFYDIPHEGDKSHHSLIERSSEYINNYIDPLDKKIDETINNIEKLENEITNKESLSEKEHPFFTNGTFLRTHAWEIEVINNIPQGLPIWVMQDGAKREFKNYETYKSVKKSLGFDLETPDTEICELVHVGNLNDIPTGKHIQDDVDLNLPIGEDLEIDLSLGDIIDYYAVNITCLEGSNIDPNAYGPSNYITRTKGSACRIKSYDLRGVTKTRQWDPGETIKLYYRKDDPYTPGNNDGVVYRSGYMKEEYLYPAGNPSIYFNDPREVNQNPPFPYLQRREIKKGEFGEWGNGNPKPGKTRDYVFSQDGNWYGEQGKHGSNDWVLEEGINTELTNKFL